MEDADDALDLVRLAHLQPYEQSEHHSRWFGEQHGRVIPTWYWEAPGALLPVLAARLGVAWGLLTSLGALPVALVGPF